jgi:transglutaminase superfamily protein
MGIIGKFLDLNPDDRRLLLRAFAAVGNAWICVRLLPPSGVLKKISAEIPLPSGHQRQTTVHIAWAVTVAARYIPGSKCLVQALAGRKLLANYGFSSAIHIGVAKDSKNWLNAHAWVEAEGKTVIGGDTAAYAPLIGASQAYRP